MPRLSKVKHGCNCLHEDTTVYPVDPGDVCCEDIAESHCAYVLLVECDQNQLGVGPMSTSVLWPCSIIRKECVTGCIWSIWRRRAFEVDDGPAPRLCDTTAKNGIVRIEDAKRVQDYCTWVDMVANGAIDSNGVDDWESFTYLFHRMWTLAPDGYGGAVLSLETDGQVVGQEGLTAVYRCASWDWTSKATFIRESVDPGLRAANLQCTICVAPLDALPLNPCYDPAHKCTCCDPGWDAGTFVLSVSGCAAWSLLYVEVVRYALPFCGVTAPSGAACGWFWGSNGNWDSPTGQANGLGVLSWCDGDAWHVEIYCYDSDTGCWVSQGEATVTNQECLCAGVYLTITLPELDCCPGGCETCDVFAGPTYPDLTISDGTNSQTMTYDSGTDAWFTDTPNTLMGACCGLPEEEVVWKLACVDGEVVLNDGVTTSGSNSFDCEPFVAIFGPFTGFDGGGPYYLTVTL